MGIDPEIGAMGAVAEALEDLEEGSRRRVLEWAADRYGASISISDGNSGSAGEDADRADKGGDVQPHEYEHFADLFDAVAPDSEPERALVAGYWWQVTKDEGTFTGYQANEVLRDVGQEASNITRAIDRLQGRDPSLARQVRKEGKTKQARKIYKLTHAGVQEVERMIEST